VFSSCREPRIMYMLNFAATVNQNLSKLTKCRNSLHSPLHIYILLFQVGCNVSQNCQWFLEHLVTPWDLYYHHKSVAVNMLLHAVICMYPTLSSPQDMSSEIWLKLHTAWYSSCSCLTRNYKNVNMTLSSSPSNFHFPEISSCSYYTKSEHHKTVCIFIVL